MHMIFMLLLFKQGLQNWNILRCFAGAECITKCFFHSTINQMFKGESLLKAQRG